MLYRADAERRTAGGRAGDVVVLSAADGSARAEVWAAHGCNCLRWRAGGKELFYVAPDWDANPVPTRSGCPVLFPFPNRIRDGKFAFQGQDFALPLNDSTKKNAIHGFAPRKAWRVLKSGADDAGAFVECEFDPKIDAPEAVGLWPGEYSLTLTHRLTANALSITAVVRNLGRTDVPFGLGFHQYLRHPGGDDISRYVLHAPADDVWVLQDSLPTGERRPVPPDLDFRTPRLVGDAQLDTLYGKAGEIGPAEGTLAIRGEVTHADAPGRVQVLTTRDFRESVLFTPAHRQAICVEPYTCATDAINLEHRGVAAGWQELPPRYTWTGQVAFRWVEA